MTAITQHEKDMIIKIIKKHAPNCDILMFGSRLRGTNNQASDLDLALVGKEKLATGVIGHIKEDFMESDIPYKVDVLDYHAVSPEFRKIIDTTNRRFINCIP